jgi:hypothetical protein
LLFEAVDDLLTWWDSESDNFRVLVISILAALPGSEDLEGLGFEPAPVGWKEVELLGNLLVSLETPDDVRYAVRELLGLQFLEE